MRNYSILKLSQYKDMVVPTKARKEGHPCELVELDSGMTSRSCDMLEGATDCFHGITDWMGNEGKRGWFCSEHQHVVCERCLQVEMWFVKNPPPPPKM